MVTPPAGVHEGGPVSRVELLLKEDDMNTLLVVLCALAQDAPPRMTKPEKEVAWLKSLEGE